MFGLTRRESAPLKRWDSPLATLREEMDDMFRNFFGDAVLRTPEVALPSIDLAETDNAVEVKTDVPGYSADEVNIEVADSELTISGEHSEETKSDDDKKYHRIERYTGSFSRHVKLPCAVDREKVDAQLKNGVLTVTLPKTEPSRTRKIRIKG
ncbi:MAG: Hsp20/alpha crystallin family protein [Planctomycetaceae bacterium]